MKTAIFILMIICSFSIVFAQNPIIFFSDSNTGDDFYDSSWGFDNAPSILELAGGGDKFPVDPNHPYQGAHSLRLHWTSNSGGNWGIAVASIGWTIHDVTNYDTVEYWINGPAPIAKADLPDIALEDQSNHASSRVWIGDYFNGVDADSMSWQKIAIPLSAFTPGVNNCDFTKIKTIYHFQKAADGVEHLSWIDEIRIVKINGGSTAPATPGQLFVKGYDSRIDLRWKRNTETNLLGYYIYSSDQFNGSYQRINPVAHEVHLYSHFFGQNDVTKYYYVTAVNINYEESPPSDTLSATSYQMTDDELMSSVQESAFRYFYDYGHPVSGLARERKGSDNVCTSGGTGFGLMTMIVGAERNFEPRDSVAARILKILKFLKNDAIRYHGAWSHWINGETGTTIPFGTYDNGGDLVETAFLVQGILTVRQYFNLSSAVETEIRQISTQLWEEVEWDWYRRFPTGNQLFWHWSPNYGWQMNMPIVGFNEAQIIYMLAVASPTHGVPASLYHDGWAGAPSYVNGNSYFSIQQWVGPPYGGPLFFTHYSYLGFDPRRKADAYCNYFDNNRNISLIHNAYCTANPLSHAGYDSLVWGITASDDPFGYSAHGPYSNDNGTITPTAALSAMPYVPEKSIPTMKYFYHNLGADLWGEFGFRDAFNMDENWWAQSYIAIDQGTIAPMIENYRSQLLWNYFMSNTEIDNMLTALGFVIGIEDHSENLPGQFELQQNYPNPFNAATTISYFLPRKSKVTIEIMNVLGQVVNVVLKDRKMAAGAHRNNIQLNELPTGIYLYRLKTEQNTQIRKMLLVK